MRDYATQGIVPAGSDSVYFRKVFALMAGALTITGAVAGAIGHSQTALNTLFSSDATMVVVACGVIELVLVFALVGLVEHMGLAEAAATFVAYAALNGVTLSLIFAVYTTKSIYATFLIVAGMFAVLALVGATTSIDLTKWGSFLGMGLVGLLIGVVVNLFWLNDTLYWVTTVIGVVLFSAYTAYDVQRLKRYEVNDASPAAVEKSAIVGALALYLDFVNLFLFVLRLFGRRR